MRTSTSNCTSIKLCQLAKMLKVVYFVLVFFSLTSCSEERPQQVLSSENSNDKIETKNETVKPRTRVLFRGNSSNKKNRSADVTLTDLLGELVSEFEDQDVVFPDAYQVIFGNIPKANIAPKCAKLNSFCEYPDSYPYFQVQDILKRNNVHLGLFGQDEIFEDPYGISNRNGDIESFVCPSIAKTVFPRIGKNKNNKWKYIINQEEKDGYIQGVRVEICRKEGSPCDLIGDGAIGYVTSCKQKYMVRRLMSLSDDGNPVLDSFQLPSACCCSYKKDLSFLSRFREFSTRAKHKNKDL